MSCNCGKSILQHKKITNIIKDGAKAQVKILTNQVNLAKTETIENRRKICYECEYLSKILNIDICGFCKCPILEKTKCEDFACDLGKWS